TTLIDASSTVPAGATCTVPPVDGLITCQLGTMAAGAEAEFVFVVLVDPTTPAGTLLTNTAVVTSTSDDPDLTNNSATATTTLVRQADLTVTKTAASTVDAGAPLTYTITITNQGPTTEPGVVLLDPLPANTTFSQVAPNPGACTENLGILSCGLGPLAAGGQLVVTVVVSVDAAAPDGTVLTNTAYVAGLD